MNYRIIERNGMASLIGPETPFSDECLARNEYVSVASIDLETHDHALAWFAWWTSIRFGHRMVDTLEYFKLLA